MNSNDNHCRIRHLIWDVDGTLFDTYPAFVQAFQQVLPEFGVSLTAAEIMALVKISVMHLLETLDRTHSIDPDTLGKRYWEVYRTIPAETQPPFPGVAEALNWIDRNGGYNLVVTHRRKETTLELLREHGFESLVKDIISTDCGFARKPDPAMFQEAIRRHQISATEAMTVGDREIDIIAGQKAGMSGCIFRPMESSTQADFVIMDYSELLVLLESYLPT